MKKIFFVLLMSAMFLACGCAGSVGNDERPADTVLTGNVSCDSVFVSGCYFVVDSGNGMARNLFGTNDRCYLKPEPIVSVGNFKDIKVVEDAFGKSALVIGLDEKGTELFADATEKWIGKQIAMLISDTVYSAPVVNMRIEGGNLMVTNIGFERNLCEELKRSLELEKKCSLK